MRRVEKPDPLPPPRVMSQDDRALTAKSVAHLCGLFSRDAWHAEHVTHSDLASIVNGEFIFIFVWAI